MHSRVAGNLRASLKNIFRPVKKWRRDESGFTAVEFGIVALPFFMLLFGIMEVGMLYFTTFSLENATEQAARLIRTGQAKTSALSAADFKTQVCNRVATYVNCTSKLRVDVESFPNFSGITPPSGLDGGGNLTSTTNYSIGNGGDVVLVTVFYQWDLTASLPFLKLGNMSNGSRLIQAAATFRNEPF